MHNIFSLENKTIVITGASSGIGRQCGISCSHLNSRVILLGRNQERLNDVMSSLENPDKHSAYSIDLTDFERVKEILENIINKHGKIDGIINSAGISTTLPLKLVTPEKINSFININVTAAVNITRLLSQKIYFSEKGGSIIFISSIMGVVGEVGKTMYSLTKGALVSVVKSMALELAPRKIRVNSVSPGVVITPMSKNAVYSQSPETLHRITELHPLGLGEAGDVANSCVFLLSDASKWITGTNLIVDGGYTAK